MFRSFVITLSLSVLSSSAFAQWELVNTESSVDYVTITAAILGESNSFKELSGSIAEDGQISVGIDLASVDTNIPLRDDRMKEMLFETNNFPTANINAEFDPALLSELEVGNTFNDSASFTLSLHGVSQELVADIQVVKLDQNKILVFTSKPILVNAEHYSLAEGVEKLREAAGLPSISTVVPVTFSLVFSRQ